MLNRVLCILGAWSCLSTAGVLARPVSSPGSAPDSADVRQGLVAAATESEPAAADAGPVTSGGAPAAWSRSLSDRGVSLSGTMTGLWICDVAGGA